MANIVIIEDEPDIAFLYRRILDGHRAALFEDMPQAVRYLQAGDADLIVLDMYLPSGFGLQLIEWMRARPDLAAIPILCISSDDSLKRTALELGAQAFLSKPISVLDMVNMVNMLLDPRSMLEETIPSKTWKEMMSQAKPQATPVAAIPAPVVESPGEVIEAVSVPSPAHREPTDTKPMPPVEPNFETQPLPPTAEPVFAAAARRPAQSGLRSQLLRAIAKLRGM